MTETVEYGHFERAKYAYQNESHHNVNGIENDRRKAQFAHDFAELRSGNFRLCKRGGHFVVFRDKHNHKNEYAHAADKLCERAPEKQGFGQSFDIDENA